MKQAISLLCLLVLLCAQRTAASAGPPEGDGPGIKAANAAANQSSGYAGTDSCIACHPKQHQSYLDSSHSQSFALTKASEEPQGGTFRHELSGRTYTIENEAGKLVHKEELTGVDGSPIVSTEFPMAYTVGSGAHAKTYLYENHGFIGQSPVTWYEGQGWEMSPGYDVPNQSGFDRSVSSDCLFCHVGQLAMTEGNPHRFSISEHAIGCERCHGPGGNHVANHQDDAATQLHDSIVNPSRMDRHLSESICEQCHLQGVIASTAPGQSAWVFRPGELLTRYRTDYQYKAPNASTATAESLKADGEMKIVGHVEQMHASPCYRESEKMTCITCHNPHETPTQANKVAIYRSACLKCHTDNSCGIEHAKRSDRNGNDCAGCHMPAAPTNVPHVAFRNHRIGIYPLETKERVAATKPPLAQTMAEIVESGELSKEERTRRKALAMYRLYDRQDPSVEVDAFHRKSTYYLFRMTEEGMADADVLHALAMDAMSLGYPDIAKNFAERAISAGASASTAKVASQRLLGDLALKRRDENEALAAFRYVARFSTKPSDLYYLGICEQNAGNTDKAIEALQRSVAIDPSMKSAHQALHVILITTGQVEQGLKHKRIIEQLTIAQQARRSRSSDAKN